MDNLRHETGISKHESVACDKQQQQDKQQQHKKLPTPIAAGLLAVLAAGLGVARAVLEFIKR